MSANLLNHFVTSFSTNLMLMLQQKGSRLAPYCTTGNYVGEAASPVDQIQPVAAQRVTGRFGPMPRVDAAVDRRWVYPVDYDLPQLVDKFDKLRLLTDPESDLVQNALYAMGRAKDDEIIAAFFGTSKTGKSGGTSTTFPTSTTTNVVGVSTGSATSSLNLAKLRAAKKMLMTNDIDLDVEQIFMAITAKEHDALLAETQVTSLDYNTKPTLVDGRVTQFMGINFIHTERVTTGTDDAAGTSNACPVWTKAGMHLGMWNDVQTEITQRSDLRGQPWQAYVKGTFGATRIDEKRVVKVWCR